MPPGRSKQLFQCKSRKIRLCSRSTARTNGPSSPLRLFALNSAATCRQSAGNSRRMTSARSQKGSYRLPRKRQDRKKRRRRLTGKTLRSGHKLPLPPGRLLLMQRSLKSRSLPFMPALVQQRGSPNLRLRHVRPLPTDWWPPGSYPRLRVQSQTSHDLRTAAASRRCESPCAHPNWARWRCGRPFTIPR